MSFNVGNSGGQFWFGTQGFLYKKNTAIGARRSTRMNAGGNTICNQPTYLYNKFKPGTGGVGASNISNRRARNRTATVCSKKKTVCDTGLTRLGLYNNSYNVNGFTYYSNPTTTIENTTENINTSNYRTINKEIILFTDGSISIGPRNPRKPAPLVKITSITFNKIGENIDNTFNDVKKLITTNSITTITAKKTNSGITIKFDNGNYYSNYDFLINYFSSNSSSINITSITNEL